MSQYTGVDIIDREIARDEHPDSGEDEEGDSGDVDAAGFIKIRWNLNASFRRCRDFPNPGVFHLINSRFLADGIKASRWRSLITEYMQLLAPGGWLQMVEVRWLFQSSYGTTLPHLEAWWNAYADALHRTQRNARIGRNLLDLVRGSGFQNVTQDNLQVPAGAWRSGMPNSFNALLIVGLRG